MTIFDRMIIDLQLLHMNLRGEHAHVTPPCSDLPTLVHTRDTGKKYRGGKYNKPKNGDVVHPWRKTDANVTANY